MKKITLSIVAISLAAISYSQSLNRSIRPKPGPAPEITLGKTESFILHNGLRVFVVENHKLPTITCSIQLDLQPELQGGMAGYRNMMSELLLSGTKTRSKDQLNGEIDQMGAYISVDEESLEGGGLKKYQEKILNLMADIAMNAEITQEDLDRAKKKSLSGLETQKNQPDAMVSNISSVVNYGSRHPYGEVATPETVNGITLDACRNYYRHYFRPNVAYMAIVGDVTASEIKPLIEKYFNNWQRGDIPKMDYPAPFTLPMSPTKVSFAPRTAAVQSVIEVTYPITDLKPGMPDVIKAKVANTILGGGSQGRLFQNIREKHGWGYGAYSSLKEDDICGSFTASLKCKNVVSDSALEALINEMKIITKEKVSDSTLQNTINYMSGSFAISLEDPKRIAQFAINIERYKMPKDYYKNYLKNLSAVTANDVMAAAAKYIRPDHANIVVAGSREEVANKLARFSADGMVDYFDYTGKRIVVSEPQAVPLGLTADDVYKKYVTAIGGEAALSKLKDVKVISTSEIQGMAITVTVMKKTGNKMKELVEADMNGKKMTFQKKVFDGTKGYEEAQGQKKNMEGDEILDAKYSADLQADLHDVQYGIKRKLKGIETIEGADAYVIETTNGKNIKSVEFYDKESGLLVRQTKSGKDPQGNEVAQSTDMSDYREVPGASGYKMPYFMSIPAGGGMSFNLKVQTVEVNKGIADTEFK